MFNKRLKLNISSDGQLSVSSNEADEAEERKRKGRLGGTVVDAEDKKLHFIKQNRFEEVDIFLEEYVEEMVSMRLTESNQNKIVELSEKLIESQTNIILKLLENKNEDHMETIKESSDYIVKKLKNVSTASKRLSEIRSNPQYVEPEEISLALKWRSKTRADSDLTAHGLVPSTCQYVPISKTLTALFSQPEFESVYVNYNSTQTHQCKEGVYTKFCCGATHKTKEIFQNTHTIQIQMAMDDFEVCCPVKSKATKHKICGIYFQILNLPPNISSKLDNIYLVALITSSDLKDDSVLNDLNELIVEDLKKLETEGFETNDGKLWKAGLINISCDNLGANFVFGFSKGFNANYYCRFCNMTHSECATATCEMPDKLRTKMSHEENIELLKENPALKLKDTEGVRMDCIYNSLESYNIFENISIDIMHDIFEGVIPSFLLIFFNHCIEKGISNENDIIRRIRDFNYGPLFDKKKPSLLGLRKPHLGQNAYQAYCIILHLPFIFFDLKPKLRTIWLILEELLRCIQIIISVEINESDINRLERHIDTYLRGILNFKETLTPKEHFLTHYPNAIRKVGPLKHLWTMRFECKHQFFTSAAQISKNFKNINKTLAKRHQEYICFKKFAIENHIEEGKRGSLFRSHSEFGKYESFLNLVANIDFDSLYILPFLKFNNYDYRCGLVLVENRMVFDILFVLKLHNEFYFLCELYETKVFERTLNSIEIEAYCPKQFAYIKHSELCNLQSFSKQICDRKIYVIAENLSVYNHSNVEA